jgi:hypothetical protein
MTEDDRPQELRPFASDHNRIFETFVDSAGDDHRAMVLGVIAYGIYKQRKREWATGVRETTGRPPTPQEIQAWVGSWTPTAIDGARSNAAEVLSAFAQSVIKDEEPRILARALKGSWIRSIVQSLTSNLIYTLILIGIAMALIFSGVDLLSVFRSAKEITQPPAASTLSNPG